MQPHELKPDNGQSAEQTTASAPPHAQAHAEHTSHVPVHYAPQTGLKLGIFACLVALALVAAFFFAQRKRVAQAELLDDQTITSSAAPMSVDVVPVREAPTTQPLKLPGEARAWYETTIYARVSGYVGKWLVDIGDQVHKDQILATLETPELDLQLVGAKAKLEASQAEVKVMEANAAFAKSTYDRWWDSPKGVVSEQEREEKKAAYDSSIAKLNSAKAQVNLDQSDVDRLAALTEFKQVKAPFDGTITVRRIDIGDLVTAGSTSSTTSLYTIAQSDQIRVFVDVPQRASADLSIGTPVDVTANELPGQEFHGKVARTARSIDPSSRTLRVEVDIPNPKLALMPGMYVEANFELVKPGLLQVPAGALVFRSSGPQVAVVGKDGRVRFRPISIAHDQGDVVDIASGLSVDERVALNIGNQVEDGEQVTAVNSEKVSMANPPATQPSLKNGIITTAMQSK